MIEALYEATGGDCILASDVGPAPDVGGAVLPLRQAAPLDQLGRAWDDGLRPAGRDGRGGRLPGPLTCVSSGDASIQMNAQELATCAEDGIPVKVFIMNNGYLGMVRQWQELFWDRRYSHVDPGRFPDFVKLADAYGATGLRFEDKSTLVEDIRRAIAIPDQWWSTSGSPARRTRTR
jgi:acetolactate synthase-1/2/3 large subunit